MKPEDFDFFLSCILTDACNRYLNLAEEMGIVDRKKRSNKSADILAARDAMLDKYIPYHTKHLADMVNEHLAKTKAAE